MAQSDSARPELAHRLCEVDGTLGPSIGEIFRSDAAC